MALRNDLAAMFDAMIVCLTKREKAIRELTDARR